MKKFLFLLFLLFILFPAIIFAAPVIIQNDYVKTAVSDNGTLGYGGSTSPGLLHDPSGNGNFGIDDYLTPGDPWEIFSVSTSQTGIKTNNNTLSTQITKSGLINNSVAGGIQDVLWTGYYGSSFEISHHYFFDTPDERIDITTVITALSDLTSLSFLRAIDPDPDVNTYGYYETINGRGYGSLSANDWVHSQGSHTGLTLGLYSNSNISHNTGVSAPWSENPFYYLLGTNDGNGDYTIGLAFDIGNLNSGSSVELNYSYIMGADIESVDIQPTPEPGTFVLFGLGLLGIAFIKRKITA